MKIIVKKIIKLTYNSIAFVLFYSGILNLFLKFKLKDKLLVIFYHEVGNNVELLGNLATKIDVFEQQIKYLQKLFNTNKDIEGAEFDRSVLVTFDGGYKGNINHALPILEKHNTPATIYIVTECVENEKVPWTTQVSYVIRETSSNHLDLAYNAQVVFDVSLKDKKVAIKKIKNILYSIEKGSRDEIIDLIYKKLRVSKKDLDNTFLSWDDVVFLSNSDFITIGSHTISHPRLTKISNSEVKKEVEESKKIIESKIGKKIESFCYPDGNINQDIVDLVQRAGYKSATTTKNGFNEKTSDLLQLKRIGGGNMPIYAFALKISGIFSFIKV